MTNIPYVKCGGHMPLCFAATGTLYIVQSGWSKEGFLQTETNIQTRGQKNQSFSTGVNSFLFFFLKNKTKTTLNIVLLEVV